jgi:hypothetical protein
LDELIIWVERMGLSHFRSLVARQACLTQAKPVAVM